MNRNSHPTRALLIADAGSTGQSIEAHLDGMEVTVCRPESVDDLLRNTQTLAPDVILADSALGSLACNALEVLRNAGISTPLIVVADSFDEGSAVGWLRAGAENLVVWSNLGRLRPAIDDALSMRQPLSRLSPRQREVLRLVALGHTTRAIAEQLGLSVKTVETHRGEVAKRLGIRDVASLVRYALRVGMVPPALDRKRVA